MSACQAAATPPQPLPPPPQQPQLPSEAERVAYAVQMRRLFSPPGMLAPDGSIDQEYFRPKQVLTLTDRKWGDAEREALLRGLERHGVGRWRDIAEELLPGWDDQSIRLKAAKLLGCQNLSWYYGRRFSKEQVAAEFEANRALGAAKGCWKHGMLVDDDVGTLRAHFTAAAAGAAQLQQQRQEQQQQAAVTAGG